MTTFGSQDVTCGNCGEESEQLTLTSFSTGGDYDLDLRPRNYGGSTMVTWLQDCPGCGLASPDLENEEDLKPILSIDEFAELRETKGSPGRFLRAAYIAEKQEDPQEAGLQMLHAAWAADDLGEDAAEYRAKAADLMVAAKPETDEHRLQLVDVLRRIKRWEEAHREVTPLLEEPDNSIRTVASFQQRLILSFDAGIYSVQQAFGG